jgi:hypothetical protein
MKPETENATEFERFTSLVDSVLSVPRADVERIKSEPLTKDRRLQDPQYLRQDIEADERRNSQVIPK